MGIMGTVKIEVMGTGTYLVAVVANIRWFFEPVAKYRSKSTAIHGTALRTALKTQGPAGKVATYISFVTGMKELAFRAFLLEVILIMRNMYDMTPYLL